MTSSDGFEEFFAASFVRIVRVLGVATGDSDGAEEAAEEAFSRALARWSKVGRMERPDGWVYATAMNVMRRRGRLREEAGSVESEPTASGDPADAVATRLSVRDGVAVLPARQRQAVLLRYLAGLSTEETARAMGCSPGTVKSTLHQAMRALRVELEDDDAG